jgi:hypothetical protein
MIVIFENNLNHVFFFNISKVVICWNEFLRITQVIPQAAPNMATSRHEKNHIKVFTSSQESFLGV